MELSDLVEMIAPYGVEQGEAEVYYHLCRTGGARAADLAKLAKRKRPDTYRILDALLMKGFAEKTLERPTRFLPVAPDIALGRRVEVQRRATDELDRMAPALVDAWPDANADAGPGSQRFTVYQGREQVHGLLERMISIAQDELILVASPGGLAHLGLAPLLASIDRQDIDVRLLTKPEPGRHEHLEASGIDVRVAELPSYHQMVIVDSSQIALFVSSGRKLSTQGDVETVLWLNSPDFVLAQKALFDAVWATALGHAQWEAAHAKGVPAPETRVLRGRWQRYDRMLKMIDHAQDSIRIRAPVEDVGRWRSLGLAAALERRATDLPISIICDGPVDLAGVGVELGSAPVLECLIDGHTLTVHGAREAGAAVAYDEEWAVWSTHPDQVAAMQDRLGDAARLVQARPE